MKNKYVEFTGNVLNLSISSLKPAHLKIKSIVTPFLALEHNFTLLNGVWVVPQYTQLHGTTRRDRH